MRRSFCFFVLLILTMPLPATAMSADLSEPWHPVREQMLALLTNGEQGSYDVWHPAVDELMVGMFNIMLKVAYLDMVNEQGVSEVARVARALETGTLLAGAFTVEYHPDRDWAIVKGPNLPNFSLDLSYGVARHRDEWAVVVPFNAETWDDFDSFADWAAYTPDSAAITEARGNESSTEWTVLDENWRYRNATIQRDMFFPMFVVELQRTGPAVEGAMFTVTLYDASNRIVATGVGNVLTVRQNAIRTVQFTLQGAPSKATHFRIQVDFEI